MQRLFVCLAFQANGGQAESKMKSLPVPVFLRPLDEKDASMKVLKIWFTTGNMNILRLLVSCAVNY